MPEEILVPLERALRAVSCQCDKAYTGRGLVAPDCQHHDLADEFEYKCECEACHEIRTVGDVKRVRLAEARERALGQANA